MASWRFALMALCCVTKSKSLSVPAAHPARLGVVDALRGSAMVWMTVFHFCFDLSHFGYWSQNFRVDPVWTLQRTVIVSLFLLCAGLGQSVAIHQGQSWGRFGRRWMQVAACALLVTLGSWAMFPRSFIYFGVLHGMAAMLPLVRATAAWRRWLWLAGGVALALPWMAHAALTGPLVDWAVYFNARSLNWLGLVSHKPFTEDYVPVLPWLGVMWWGMAAGNWLLEHRPQWLHLRLPVGLQGLAVLGRWSLSYYMLHQPVLIGLLLLWGVVSGRGA